MRLFQRTVFAAFAVVCLALAQGPPASAGVILVDFGIVNGSAEGWDAIERLVMNVPYPLTDRSGGGDDDVAITALDDGFNPNNTAPPGVAAVHDGFTVPIEAVDDYLFKITDQAGTTARMRIDNLDPGNYDITLFEGRTSDANQVAKLWVGDDSGSNEPGAANTASFAGGADTLNLTIGVDEVLWYRHLEDGSGGISGMIIQEVPEPSTLVLSTLALLGLGIVGLRRRGLKRGRS